MNYCRCNNHYNHIDEYGEKQTVNNVTLNCESATCDFRARGSLVKQGRNWIPNEELKKALIEHHIDTGGGQSQSTLNAHREFLGADDFGRTLHFAANSYGVEITE